MLYLANYECFDGDCIWKVLFETNIHGTANFLAQSCLSNKNCRSFVYYGDCNSNNHSRCETGDLCKYNARRRSRDGSKHCMFITRMKSNLKFVQNDTKYFCHLIYQSTF